MMAFPLVGVYLPMYEYILDKMKSGSSGSTSSSMFFPLVAGTISRGVSVLSVGPLELLRTRRQAVSNIITTATPQSSPSSPFRRRRPPPLRSLWTGVSATLARDVPYSALYWFGVENLRTLLLSPPFVVGGDGREARGENHLLLTNVVAGALSGSTAAAITTPLDVIKTRMQTAKLFLIPKTVEAEEAVLGVVKTTTTTTTSPSSQLCFTESFTKQHLKKLAGSESAGQLLCAPELQQVSRGWWCTLRTIWYEGGVPALFAGWGPRSARAAPACAIVLSTYEVLKSYLAR